MTGPARRKWRTVVLTATGIALTVTALIVAALTTTTTPRASAGALAPPASLTVAAPADPVTAGEQFTVDVLVHSDSNPVNAVQADLTFRDSQIEFVSSVVNDTAWPITAASTGGPGMVSVQVAASAPVTGDSVIATVTFTAREDGTPAITVAGSSLALDANTNENLLVEPAIEPTPAPNPIPTATPMPSHPAGSGGQAPIAARANVRAVRWHRRALGVRLRCPAAASSRCEIKITLRKRRSGRTVAATSASIRAGRARTVTLQLTKPKARRVRRHPSAYRLHIRTVTSAGQLRSRVQVPGPR